MTARRKTSTANRPSRKQGVSKQPQETVLPPQQSALESRPAWMRTVLALGILWLSLACIFPQIVFQNKIFQAPDYEAPADFYAAGQRALAEGEYPLWNPYIFLGMPSFGSLMFTAYVFPLSEVLNWFGKLPFAPKMSWLLFYFLAAGFGVYVLLRWLGASYWASLVAASAFMLTPHLVSMGVFGHGSKLASIAFLPYLLWALLALVRTRKFFLWVPVLSLLLGFQMLRGHPQIVYYGLLMLGWVWLFEMVSQWRKTAGSKLIKTSVAFTVALGLGIMLAAVLFLPVRAYAPHSIRGDSAGGGADYQFATGWSMAPQETITFAVPSAFGFGEGTYVGSMPFTNFPNYLGQSLLLFAAAAFFVLRGRQLWVLTTVALISLLVSFGKEFSPVYDLFYHFLPYFNKFRVPVMILVLLQLSVAVLAGLGLTALWGELPRGFDWRQRLDAGLRRKSLGVAMAVALLLLAGCFLGRDSLRQRVQSSPRLPQQVQGRYAQVAADLMQSDAVRLFGVVLAHAAVLGLSWRRTLPHDIAGLALVGLVIWDLGAVDRRMIQPQKTWPGLVARLTEAGQAQAPPTPLMTFLQEQVAASPVPPRVLPVGTLFQSNEWMRYGISSVGGYQAAQLSRFRKFLDRNWQFDPVFMNLWNVEYLVSPEEVDLGWERLYTGPDGYVYRNPQPQPRAWITGRYRLAAEDCLDQLAAADFEPRREVVLEESPAQPLRAQATGEAHIRSFGANEIQLDVEASEPALLVVAEAYHPDWKATVNGEEARVVPVNCLLRGVAVPAGSSQVRLRFEDRAVRAGLGLSLASAVLILALLAYSAVNARSGRQGEDGGQVK